MKITIDTQTDTHEDIKKVLNILTNILESSHSAGEHTSSIRVKSLRSKLACQQESKCTAPTGREHFDKKDAVEQTDSTPMMGMFSDSSSQDSQQSQPVSSELPQTSGFQQVSESQQTSEPLHASEFSQTPELRQISDPSPIEPQTAEEEPETPDTPPNFNALLDLTRKKEEKKDPKIEFF